MHNLLDSLNSRLRRNPPRDNRIEQLVKATELGQIDFPGYNPRKIRVMTSINFYRQQHRSRRGKHMALKPKLMSTQRHRRFQAMRCGSVGPERTR